MCSVTVPSFVIQGWVLLLIGLLGVGLGLVIGYYAGLLLADEDPRTPLTDWHRGP